jgi:predicted transposase YdaD
MYKELDNVADIEIKILDLIRHTVNMDQERVVRTIFESKPVGGRRMGRPRQRRLEDARKEIGETKVKIWRQKAVNRADWMPVIKEAKAKALRGPQGQKVST